MTTDPWANDPDRTTRREAYRPVSERAFLDEIELLVGDYTRPPWEQR